MNFKLTIVAIFFSLCFHLQAQNKSILGYKIEGDEVVFSFDIRDYKKATNEVTQRRLDFKDLDIENVAVSGDFNNWSRDQWKMKKINDNLYELRKNIDDFNDAFLWEFKFVINNKYWAEPDNKAANLVPAKAPNGLPLFVYNLKMSTASLTKNGNINFRLNGYLDAKEVILAGSFNKWDEHFFKMNKTKNGWALALDLKPGEYEYKFIVDGHWLHDPNNPAKRINEHGTYNSVINIQVPVTFRLNGYRDAEQVILSGSFNEWDEKELKMSKTSEGWESTILLSAGKHHYKFIVDGQWLVDPNNTVKEYDFDGNVNSVVMVK